MRMITYAYAYEYKTCGAELNFQMVGFKKINFLFCWFLIILFALSNSRSSRSENISIACQILLLPNVLIKVAIERWYFETSVVDFCSL